MRTELRISDRVFMSGSKSFLFT